MASKPPAARKSLPGNTLRPVDGIAPASGDGLFQAWRQADAIAGPQQSYRLACRLTAQLRPFGRSAAALADWALAHTLFWRGRFVESHAVLATIRLDVLTPEPDAECNLALLLPLQLSWVLAMRGETEGSLSQAELALNWVQHQLPAQSNPVHLAMAESSLSLLHCFLDAPAATLKWSLRAQASAARTQDTRLVHSTTLLEYWARSRLGETAHEGRTQTALAALHRHGPAHAARAFSLYAQARFHQLAPHALAYAQTQLDAALDLNARCGLHHWEARLLHMKSQSLDAAGQLHEASRFQRLAQETAQRQGAKLFLANISGIESRP